MAALLLAWLQVQFGLAGDRFGMFIETMHTRGYGGVEIGALIEWATAVVCDAQFYRVGVGVDRGNKQTTVNSGPLWGYRLQ